MQTGGDSCLAEHSKAYRNPKPNPTFLLPPGFWKSEIPQKVGKIQGTSKTLIKGKYILDTPQRPKISVPELSKLIHTLILTPFRTKATIVALPGAFLKALFGFPLLTNARCICSESTSQVPLGAGNSLLCALEEEEKEEENDDAPWKDAATRWQTQFDQHKTIPAAL